MMAAAAHDPATELIWGVRVEEDISRAAAPRENGSFLGHERPGCLMQLQGAIQPRGGTHRPSGCPHSKRTVCTVSAGGPPPATTTLPPPPPPRLGTISTARTAPWLAV
jgi:hypothetical protein